MNKTVKEILRKPKTVLDLEITQLESQIVSQICKSMVIIVGLLCLTSVVQQLIALIF